MTDEQRAYLQAANIVRLQAAARIAGLRWRNGEPGTDKAGIIERLERSPSMMRATIARLEAMSRGEDIRPSKPVRSLAEELADEARENEQTVEAPASVSAPSQISEAVLAQYAKRADVHSWIEDEHSHADRIGEHAVSQIRHLQEQINTLNERKPVQFVIEGKILPPVSGQHALFSRLCRWLALRSIDRKTGKGHRTHAVLIGPASSGKTSAAVAFAEMLGLELYAQPLTMDAFGVLGYTSPDGKQIETEFTRAWQYGGVFLWDEISMSAPEAVGALNSALANGFIAIPGIGKVYAHPDFYMIAGDNSDTGASLKYGARSLLDGASLDRFVRIDWPIDPAIESTLAGSHADWLYAVRAIRAEIDKRGIAHVGATMRAVITGRMALESGVFSRTEILEDTCKKGLIAEEWDQYTRLPAVQTFLRG